MAALSESVQALVNEPLAVHGGPMAVPESVDQPEAFAWPIMTEEDEQAAAAVIRSGRMSELDISEQFEREFADYCGCGYGLTFPNGTMALLTAMWAVGLRRGDEMICPSVTYWGSAAPAMTLGATVVFADVDPSTLCLDPGDLERHITPRTKAIMVVHYLGHPADMEAIQAIARKHELKIIEDVSHAQGGLYRGKMTGTFGDVAAMSLMSQKALPIGEGGILVTDDGAIAERAIAFAHYRRHAQLTDPQLEPYAQIPLGAVKGRLNQVAAAVGRVQLKHYPARMARIQSAMNRFYDLLEGTPGLRAHRVQPGTDSTMGGWYDPAAIYVPEELGGLAVTEFCRAVWAEGGKATPGVNFPLHLHPYFNTADVYGHGKPTRLAWTDRDVRQGPGTLVHAEQTRERAMRVPWFKQDLPELIERYAAAYRKVALQAESLIHKPVGS